MTQQPRSWAASIMGLAFMVLAAAAALYLAAKLVLAVLPVLIGGTVVVFVGLLGWQLREHRRSRW